MFWKVYFKLLFSWQVWTHWFFAGLILLHVVNVIGNPEWAWRLPVGLAAIFGVGAVMVFVGCVGGYLDHLDHLERNKAKDSILETAVGERVDVS